MKINVLAFGAAAEIIGKSNFEITGVDSTAALISKLENDFPAIKKIKYAVAVNKQIITGNTSLDADCTVALLPPFSGG